MKEVIIGSLLLGWIILIVWHPYPYNTETICFDKEANVVFYARGYKPGIHTSPVLKINNLLWTVRKTGQVIKGTCNQTWGVAEPRGVEHYENNIK